MFYRPVYDSRYHDSMGHDRHFSREITYSKINWGNLSSIVNAFEKRIDEWYFIPANCLAKCGHNAFSVAAIDCLLIDMMAQFEDPEERGNAVRFINYAKNNITDFRKSLPEPIRRSSGKSIENFAEALYYGFRCSIMHEAHIPPYCQIFSDSAYEMISFRKTGIAMYEEDRIDCCGVCLNPIKLLKEIERLFKAYISNLRSPDTKHDKLRANFKKKFKSDYGIDIDGAKLEESH